MVVCTMPGCQTSAGCQCGRVEYQRMVHRVNRMHDDGSLPEEDDPPPAKRPVERITGVALLTNEGELWSLPKPNRHCHLFALAAFQGNHADPCKQGFTTNTGRYVSREEAKEIVRSSGQDYKTSFAGPDPKLYSEDVW